MNGDEINQRLSLFPSAVKVKYGMLFIVVLLSMVVFFTNLGITPVRLEEARRALTSMEMSMTGDFVVPRTLGELDLHKPPFFYWVLIGTRQLFGTWSEFMIRLPTVLSFLLIGLLMFWAGRKFLSFEFGLYSSSLFLISGGLLFNFSMLGEIDLFYSLVTFASFMALFVCYQSGHLLGLFLLTYGLTAIGTLTKGIPSPVFLIISIVVFFSYKHALKLLFTWQHFVGIMFFVAIVGGYAKLYSLRSDLDDLLSILLMESMERTAAGGVTAAGKFLKHIFVFPLDTLVQVFPGSLLLVFCFRRDFVAILRRNPLTEFSLFIFVGNFLPYWISPGTRARYIYMLYPFLIMIFVYFFLHFRFEETTKRRFFYLASGFLILLSSVACLTLPFIPSLHHIPNRIAIGLASAVLMLGIFLLFVKRPYFRLFCLILVTLLTRGVFDLTVLPLRTTEGRGAREKASAQDILRIVQDKPLYFLRDVGKVGSTVPFYLARERNQIIRRRDELLSNTYILGQRSWFVYHGSKGLVVHSFVLRGTTFELVKEEL